jgi:hypothetical protein
MGEFRLKGFRKMGHWRRIRSRQASKPGRSAVSWLLDGRRRKRCKKIAGA